MGPSRRFQNFFDILGAWDASRLTEAPAVAELPSPWEAWTFLGLAKHRERQAWVADILRTRLGGDPTRFAQAGYMGHPEERPGTGLVPGLPAWEYRLHGRGCELTNRNDGSCIDVDFVDDTPDFIDHSFFKAYLESLKHPEPVERRLMELHPHLDILDVAFLTLREAGLLVGEWTVGFKVAPEVVGRLDLLQRVIRRWESNDPVGAPLGWLEWLCSGERDEQVRRERIAQLKDRLQQAPTAGALRGLHALGDAEPYLRRILGGPPGAAMSAALDLIAGGADPRWCEPLFDLLIRTDPGNDFLRMRCLAFLFRHAHRPQDLRREMARPAEASEGEMALLALEHAPDLALSIFRRALRSKVPLARDEAAAVLALFDRPWSRRELLAVLSESTDPHATAAACSALRLCHDRESVAAADGWDQAHGRPLPEGRFVKVDEAMLRHSDSWIGALMEGFHERVMRIRDVEPK